MIAENISNLLMKSQEILIASNFKILIPKQQQLFSKEEILEISRNSDYVGLIIFDQNLDLEEDLQRMNLLFFKLLEQNFTQEGEYGNLSQFRKKIEELKSARNSSDQFMQTPITIIINIKNAIYSNIFIICVKIILNGWEQENEFDNFSKLCIKQWKLAEEAVEFFQILASQSTNISDSREIPQIIELPMPPLIIFPRFQIRHRPS